MKARERQARLRLEDAAAERELRDLLAAAGPRPAVPSAELVRIRAAAREEWRGRFGRPARRRRTWAPLALAAGLVAAVGAGWWWSGTRAPLAAPVAALERLAGEVRVGTPGAAAVAAAGGSRLAAGSEVAVAAGGESPAFAALRLAGGAEVRVAAGSRIVLASSSRLALEAGAIYVDSGAGGGAVEIHTGLGEVRELGTRFEVRLIDGGTDRLRVRVREGAVAVDRGADRHRAEAGQELTVGRDGSVERAAVEAWGDAWGWVAAAAPGLPSAGLTLAGFLDWVEREAGLEVRFTDPRSAAAAPDVRLYGAFSGLTPEQAIGVVLPGSGFGYELTDGVLVIGGSELDADAGRR